MPSDRNTLWGFMGPCPYSSSLTPTINLIFLIRPITSNPSPSQQLGSYNTPYYFKTHFYVCTNNAGSIYASTSVLGIYIEIKIPGKTRCHGTPFFFTYYITTRDNTNRTAKSILLFLCCRAPRLRCIPL